MPLAEPVTCLRCQAPRVGDQPFCGGCGEPHGVGEAPAAATPPAKRWSAKGFRGPKVLAITGLTLAVAGWIVCQVILGSLPSLTTRSVLVAAASGDLDANATMAQFAAFAVGALVAALGAVMVVWAAIWGLIRLGRGEKSRGAAAGVRVSVQNRTPSAAQIEAAARQGRDALAPALEQGAVHGKRAAAAGAVHGKKAAVVGATQGKKAAVVGATQGRKAAGFALTKAREARQRRAER